MTVIDLDAVREHRTEEREGVLFERVRVMALSEAERAFAVANSIVGVDPDMAMDVCRGTRRRLLVRVRGAVHDTRDDVRSCLQDLASHLYQARMFGLSDGRFDCGAPRQT